MVRSRKWNLLDRLKKFGLLAFFFSAFITVLYALSMRAASSMPMQFAFNGENEFVSIGGSEISETGTFSEVVTVKLSLANGAILSRIVEILGHQMGASSGMERPMLQPMPILTISKDDDPPDNVQPGAVLTYAITYSNVGNAKATEVIIIDTFDNNVTFEQSRPSPAGGAGNVRYWQIGDLHKGDHGNITATVRVSTSAVSSTVLTNLVQIDSPDAEMASSTQTTTVVCPVPILAISKDDDPPDNVQPGAVLTYAITYSNVGNADATGVIITDTLDNKVTFKRSWPSPAGGTGNVRYWQIGDLHKGDHGNITALVTVSTSAVSGTVLTNLVQIDSPDTEIVSGTETTRVMDGNQGHYLYLPIIMKSFCTDVSPCDWDIYEPNNGMCSAHPISTSTCIESYICSSSDLKDYYYIDITTYNKIDIKLTSLPKDYDLYLYDSPTALEPVDRSENWGQEDESITYNPTHTGRYYIRVHPYVDGVYSDTDSYRLCVNFD